MTELFHRSPYPLAAVLRSLLDLLEELAGVAQYVFATFGGLLDAAAQELLADLGGLVHAAR